MLSRFLMILSVVVLVSACSSAGDEVLVGDQPTMTNANGQYGVDNGGLNGDGINGAGVNNSGLTGYDQQALGAPTPGSAEDFVTNVGNRVYFGTDSYSLTPEARRTLEAQARWLEQYSNLNIAIEGHADERGTREYNIALGDRRANSIENYLVAYGIDPRRVRTISFGKERPEVVGATASSWSQNRRGITRID